MTHDALENRGVVNVGSVPGCGGPGFRYSQESGVCLGCVARRPPLATHTRRSYAALQGAQSRLRAGAVQPASSDVWWAKARIVPAILAT